MGGNIQWGWEGKGKEREGVRRRRGEESRDGTLSLALSQRSIHTGGEATLNECEALRGRGAQCHASSSGQERPGHEAFRRKGQVRMNIKCLLRSSRGNGNAKMLLEEGDYGFM